MQDFVPCKVPFFAGTEPKLFLLKRENQKIVLVMRITAILLLAATLQVSAKGWGQEKISLSFNNAPIEQVFNAITTQTDIAFLYRPQYVKGKKVTIQITNANLKTVLDLCLKDQQLTYEIVGKNVAIRPITNENVMGIATENIPQMAEKAEEIAGRVTNDQGEPLAGANVIIKRSGTGTITNANGQFTLKNVNGDDVLLISYVGYSTLSLKVGDKSNFMVVMHIAANKLDEAVVQAYGKTTDRLRTGNISRVTSRDIEKQPVLNVLNVLQGQIPGAVVTNVSGYSSGTVKIEIRGRNTINADFPSDPLYIIDGVPLTLLSLTPNSNYANGSQGVVQGVPSPANGQSPFFNINPNDIESIEVLKDADATAIYGSRASNGVILITTKKGKAGKAHFEINVSQGISEITKHYDMLNTQQYVEIRKEALKNDNLPVNIVNAADLVAWDTTKYTDWQKYLWGGKGHFTDVKSSLSGGNNQTTYRIGTGYSYQRDILAVSGGNYRGSFSLNFNTKSVDQRFSLGISSFYTYTQSDLIYIPNAVALPPNAPDVFDDKGNLNYKGWAPLDANFPFGALLQPYTAKTNLLNANMVIGIQILKGLQFSTNLGYNNVQGNQMQLTTIASQNPLFNPKGQSSFGNTFFHNIIIEPQLNYKRIIGKGKIEVLIGGSAQKNQSRTLTTVAMGYGNDLLISSINAAPNKFPSENTGQYRYAAAFSRINYNYKDKYIISLNGRRDGSSRFGPGKQYGNFGSVGGAWLFSEENWLNNHLKLLSFGKLRASYGITGGDQIADYAYLSLWQYQTGQYNGFTNLLPKSHVDSLMHWEVNKKLEVGLMLGVLDNRLTLEVSWYRNRCGDQLVYFPTPSSTGFINVISNLQAEVENSGWEFNGNAKIIEKASFKLSTKLLIGINRNKLVSYPGLSNSPYAGSLVVGQPLNIQKLLHFDGIDPQTGKYTFDDKNTDGKTTVDFSGKIEDDRYIHNMTPKFDGGFTTELNYKAFDLSVYFYFRKQMGYSSIISAANFPGSYGNQSTRVLNHWQKSGDITTIGKLSASRPIEYFYYTNYSDGVLSDASFIRLQNLSLSYTFPKKISQKIHSTNLRIFAQGQNLFVITSFDGIDPETQFFGALPKPKVFTVGLSCNF
jgi:TonB-linked SusC/RagA family outer membrane protein